MSQGTHDIPGGSRGISGVRRSSSKEVRGIQGRFQGHFMRLPGGLGSVSRGLRGYLESQVRLKGSQELFSWSQGESGAPRGLSGVIQGVSGPLQMIIVNDFRDHNTNE